MTVGHLRDRDLSHLGQVPPLHRLQDMFASLGVVDEGVTLGAVYDLKMLSPRLAEDRFRRHEQWMVVGRRAGGTEFLAMSTCNADLRIDLCPNPRMSRFGTLAHDEFSRLPYVIQLLLSWTSR